MSGTAHTDHAGLMDRMYRHQRHLYDATRKYYLLGRDPMIEGLAVPRNGAVLEIGCGTGRNLIAVGRQYPSARLFGIDISREMLRTAGDAIVRAGLAANTGLAQADAVSLDTQKLFGRTGFDRIFISYALSMIPQWQAVLDKSFDLLSPGGELHIVDFGDLAGLPRWTRSALYAWLERFHVTPRNDLFEIAAATARQKGGEAKATVIRRGFAWISVIKRPDRLIAVTSPAGQVVLTD